jgi:phospholipid/cholesterol/gamma-HCH transport system substrate-binding protein
VSRRTQLRRYLPQLLASLALVALALVTGWFILDQQGYRFPWTAEPYRLHMELATAQAVVPGQGQTVRVAGVRVGDVADVHAHDGYAVLDLDLDAGVKGRVHRDASALLRPRTPLKDMFIELDPGSPRAPVAPAGFTIPRSRTAPDVNLDQINSMLDRDTRDYLQMLISGAARGLKGRSGDLRDVMKRFEPTFRDVHRVSGAVAVEHRALRRLVTSLNLVSETLDDNRGDLSRLVQSSSAVFRAFASEQRNVTAGVARLPGALRQTADTLQRVRTYAQVLKPAARRLVPVARAVPPSNAALRPFATEAAPILRDELRPFAREAQPFVHELGLPAARYAGAAPELTRVGTVFNHLFNLLAYQGDHKSFLFWLAWASHQGANVWTIDDANGPMRPTLLVGSCKTLSSLEGQLPGADAVLNLLPLKEQVCQG